MAAVTICSDFGAQKNKVCHCFHCFPIYFQWIMGPDVMILVFWMLSLSQLFHFPLSFSSRGFLVVPYYSSQKNSRVLSSSTGTSSHQIGEMTWFSSLLFGHLVSSSVTLWTTACQSSLSFTNSWSLLKLMFIESVMPPNHLILCCPLLLPSIFPSIRVFSCLPCSLTQSQSQFCPN